MISLLLSIPLALAASPIIIIPSTSGVSVSRTVYTNPTTVPTEYNEWMIHHRDLNGTVFIAVGTIIMSILTLLLLVRFWLWLKYRREARDAALVDIDDYYGTIYDNDSKSIFLDEEKKGGSTYELTLNYDSNFFREKKNTSSNNSYFTNHSSNPSTSSSALSQSQSPQTINKQGHQLRNALNSSNISTYQMMNMKRSSYISPINELMKDENNLSSMVSLDSDNRSPTVPIISRHQKSSSISLLLQMDQSQSKLHLRSPSTDFKHLQELVQRSIDDENSNDHQPQKMSTERTHSRPPSVILDMFANQSDDEQIN